MTWSGRSTSSGPIRGRTGSLQRGLASELPARIVWVNWFRLAAVEGCEVGAERVALGANVLAIGCQSLTIFTLLGSFWNRGVR